MAPLLQTTSVRPKRFAKEKLGSNSGNCHGGVTTLDDYVTVNFMLKFERSISISSM